MRLEAARGSVTQPAPDAWNSSGLTSNRRACRKSVVAIAAPVPRANRSAAGHMRRQRTWRRQARAVSSSASSRTRASRERCATLLARHRRPQGPPSMTARTPTHPRCQTRGNVAPPVPARAVPSSAMLPARVRPDSFHVPRSRQRPNRHPPPARIRNRGGNDVWRSGTVPRRRR